MVLVDTSIWIDHFRKGVEPLRHCLLENDVLGHPFVVGELACGNLKNRKEVLSLLLSLPQAQIPELEEVLHWIESHRLSGKGLGLIDVHLLAAAALSHATLWTADKRLANAAQQLGLSYVV